MDKNDQRGKKDFTYLAFVFESFENTDFPNGRPDVETKGLFRLFNSELCNFQA